MGPLVAAHRLLSCGMRTLSCGMHVGSSSLDQGSNLGPLHWERGVSTTAPPGKYILPLLHLSILSSWFINTRFEKHCYFCNLHRFINWTNYPSIILHLCHHFVVSNGPWSAINCQAKNVYAAVTLASFSTEEESWSLCSSIIFRMLIN